jgi:molecular chaperone DnaK
VHVLQGEREMAMHNKTIGNFRLGGIPPAPRGVPQIEVTFDIDANGIVHVSAKDLGTGNEQKITITASSNLSEADIEKAVKDAERFADEDKQKRDEVDTRNNADSMVYQCEKTIGELGDKLDSSDKSALESKLNALKDLLKNNASINELKEGTEALQKSFYEVSAKIYQQNPGAGGPGGPGDPGAPFGGGGDQGGDGDDVFDAEYKPVDDDDN